MVVPLLIAVASAIGFILPSNHPLAKTAKVILKWLKRKTDTLFAW